MQRYENYRKAAIKDADICIKLWSALTTEWGALPTESSNSSFIINTPRLITMSQLSINDHELDILEDDTDESK